MVRFLFGYTGGTTDVMSEARNVLVHTLSHLFAASFIILPLLAWPYDMICYDGLARLVCCFMLACFFAVYCFCVWLYLLISTRLATGRACSAVRCRCRYQICVSAAAVVSGHGCVSCCHSVYTSVAVSYLGTASAAVTVRHCSLLLLLVCVSVFFYDCLLAWCGQVASVVV